MLSLFVNSPDSCLEEILYQLVANDTMIVSIKISFIKKASDTDEAETA